MGLLYPLPISTDESDFVYHNSDEQVVILKSYGLPYIFWIYGLAAFIVYVFMMLGVSSTLQALLESTDQINKALAISFLVFVILLPITILGFFFYQKIIIADHKQMYLRIFHKAFGVAYKSQAVHFPKAFNLEINHHLDSPNMARLQKGEDMRGFKNKGYFLLEAVSGEQRILIDRSSSKADLNKIKALLILATYKNNDDL